VKIINKIFGCAAVVASGTAEQRDELASFSIDRIAFRLLPDSRQADHTELAVVSQWAHGVARPSLPVVRLSSKTLRDRGHSGTAAWCKNRL